MWVGGVADSQTRSKPPQKKFTPKIAFFDPNFTFRFPKYKKNWGGWVGLHTGDHFPNQKVFWDLP